MQTEAATEGIYEKNTQGSIYARVSLNKVIWPVYINFLGIEKNEEARVWYQHCPLLSMNSKQC